MGLKLAPRSCFCLTPDMHRPPASSCASHASLPFSLLLTPQAYRTQLNLFLAEVRSQQTLPLLKQYLILYSSISMSKLSSLMDIEEQQLRTQLACLKNKAYNLRQNGSADATAGVWVEGVGVSCGEGGGCSWPASSARVQPEAKQQCRCRSRCVCGGWTQSARPDRSLTLLPALCSLLTSPLLHRLLRVRL